MANYNTLKSDIQAAIYQNGENAITGQILQEQLLSMVTSLGAGYQYGGVATPSTNPGEPDYKVFYLAGTEGTYTNFGGIVVANEVAILYGSGTSWAKANTGIKFVSVSQNTETTIKKAVSIEIGGVKSNIQDKDLNERVAEVAIMTHYAGWFNSGGVIGSLPTARFVVIPIDSSITTWAVKTNVTKSLALFYLASFSGQPNDGDTLDLVSGTNRIVLDENKEYNLPVPSGTNYIAFCVVTVSGEDASPQKVIISGVDHTKPIRTIISEILSNYNTLQTNVNSISANLSSTNAMLGKASGVTPEYSAISNHYVQSNGNVVSYNNYNMTTPILMFPNDKIVIKTRFYNTGIAAIAKTNIDGTQYTQLVESKADSEAVEYTYIATEKCYVALSYVASQMAYIKMDMLEALHSVASESGEAIDSIDFLPLLSDNPLERIRFDAGMTAVFRKWGFVGDSLSSGAFEYNEGGIWGATDDYEISWGQALLRLTGADGFNFSVGGEMACTWIKGRDDGKNNRRWGNGQGGVQEGGAHDNLKDAYIISLGVNDRAHMHDEGHPYYTGIGTFAEDVDVSDYTHNNEDTFAGCYAGIIQRIQSVQPKAKFFCVSLPFTQGEQYNAVIQDCVAAFDNCYYIDLATYGPQYMQSGESSEFRNRYFIGGHMNALGYQHTCYTMATYIDWIIRKNIADFADVQYIGTNHSWTD